MNHVCAGVVLRALLGVRLNGIKKGCKIYMAVLV